MEEIIVVIEMHWMMGIKAKERLLIWLRVNNLLSGGQQHSPGSFLPNTSGGQQHSSGSFLPNTSGGQQHSPGSFLAQHAAYADVMLQI